MAKPLTENQMYDRAFLTGTIMGLLAKQTALSGSIIHDVKPVYDEAGNYMPYIDVVLASGAYRIAVLHETLIEEEP